MRNRVFMTQSLTKTTQCHNTVGMKVIHIINKVPEGEVKPRGMKKVPERPENQYSCCWELGEGFDGTPTVDEVRSLIGGRVFFHKTKGDRSYFGGSIVDVQPCRWDDPDYKETFLYHVDDEELERIRKNRYHIEFTPTTDSRGVKWRGKLKKGRHTVIGEVIEVDE